MEQEKIKAYYQIWSEAWKLFRKWALDFQDDDSFWQRAVKEAGEFSAQYKDTEFARFANRIMIDILEELETKALGKRGKE